MANFSIIPESGYVNTTFAFKFDNYTGPIEVKVYKGSSLLSAATLSTSSTIYQKIKDSGTYSVFVTSAGITSEKQFLVTSSLQLGSSVLKESYIFPSDGCVYLVKKDRIKIYDYINHSSYEVTGISPTKILEASKKSLLFITNISGEVSNVAFFNRSTLTIEESFECFKIITIDEEALILWALDGSTNDLFFIDLKAEDLLVEVASTSGRLISFDSAYLVYETDFVSIFEISTGKEVERFPVEEPVAICMKEHLTIKLKNSKIEVRAIGTSRTITLKAPQRYRIANDLTYRSDAFNVPTSSSSVEDAVDELREIAVTIAMRDSIEAGEEFEVPISTISSRDFDNIQIKFLRLSQELLGETIVEKKIITSCRARKSKYYSDPENILWHFLPELNESYSVAYSTSVPVDGLEHRENLQKYQSSIYSSRDGRVGLLNVYSQGELTSNQNFVFGGDRIIEATTNLESREKEFFQYQDIYYMLLDIYGGKTLLYEINGGHVNQILSEPNKIYHPDYLQYGLLWFRDTTQHPHLTYKIYDVDKRHFLDLQKEIPQEIGAQPLQKGYYKVDINGTFYDKIYVTPNNVVVSVDPFEIRSAVVGKVLSSSQGGDLVLTHREAEGYCLFQYERSLDRFLTFSIPDKEVVYANSQLVPNGQFALMEGKGASGELNVFDIEKQEFVRYLTGKFVGFTNEGSIILENDMTKQKKILDGTTFEDITPAQYHYYRFQSPDGKLYSQLLTTSGYFNFLENKEISKEEYFQFLLDFEIEEDEREAAFKARYERNLKRLLAKYQIRYPHLNVRFITHDFIARPVNFVEIGICGTDIVAKLPADRLRYYNYLSFSYDNKYVGYVGKPNDTGLFQIFKISFNESLNTLTVDDYATIEEPSFATWTCAFSKDNNYFGTSDSDPNSFLVKVDESLFQKKYYGNSYSENIKKLSSKSFECFSPNGERVALSEKGYEPISLGGRGHISSRDLYLAETATGSIVRRYQEHGGFVKFAAFSEDGKKLLSLSDDGVVIIRDIEDQVI